jgi:hypothetical protein
MRPTVAAPALALLCACAGGYTPGQTLPTDGNGIPIGGNGDGGNNDAGDAGQDAGPDAGCTVLLHPSAGILDGCISTPATPGTASVNVTPPGCSVTISGTTTYSSCSGTAHGASNSFSGTCGSYPCTSTSLPGNLICTAPGMTSCTVTVCDGGC